MNNNSVEIYTDGGSRGNPGDAALGYLIKENSNVLYAYGEPIGTATNNQAEYAALYAALVKAKQLGYKSISVFMDSELVVKQMLGLYKVKNQDLLKKYKDIKSLERYFEEFSITHVKREYNKEADSLVNLALDSKKIVITDNIS